MRPDQAPPPFRRAALALAAGLALAPAGARADGLDTAGDVLKYALPGAAAVCAWKQERLASYATGFGVMALSVEGLKYGLGDSGINERPNGESHGFPSGHTAAAASGATDLSLNCAPGNPWVAAGTAAATVLVGASRIDTDEHDLVQVLAGAAIGFFSTGIRLERTAHGGYGLSYSLNF
ncbi:phosphatase PAP2 family protein [Amaricoccus solimangrovi]|uniref:Phosphatase PAP2 family protein n=1 Tax=Amaricoccus solimangrovi TaxID=2589815 RepID=A0A501WXK9_9RHOB|nr:phosphatase PAP2 family protein [Amaricoccus solimangrovi]TPE53200.1 phosphatase PAP2 family protein [Amaricoccus solimangrovi]